MTIDVSSTLNTYLPLIIELMVFSAIIGIFAKIKMG